jgi:hypothetical protein
LNNNQLFLKELIGLTSEKKAITKLFTKKREEVNNAKLRVEIEPELKNFLEKFQKKEQEKLVGINQNLLTAILGDVFGNDVDKRKVIMDIFTERGLPGLSIFIEKNDQGVLEDVYNGSGGAVANILSLGLRAIALIQSKERRFLVLDEPDCWIKPEIIPEFVQVINQISEKLKIQILMISHHDEVLLNEIPDRLLLEKQEDGAITCSWTTNNIPDWKDGEEGIRSLYLENFQSHTSTFIPLGKTVTLLTGKNDLGKSTIVNALRAVFYGLGDDTNIKHFENETKVTVDFGDTALFWERKLKGKPKEVFTLVDSTRDFSRPLHRTESAREVPTWVKEETGIGLIEGFDIQLGHQKKPVFLLDESPSKKAKVLSIGDESNYVQQMINLSKEDLTYAKNIIKKGEEDLERWYKTLRIYEKYDIFKDGELEKVEETIKKIEELNRNDEKFKEKLRLLEELKEKTLLKEKIENFLEEIEKNKLNDNLELKTFDIKKLSRWFNLKKTNLKEMSMVEEKKIHDKLYLELFKLLKKQQILPELETVNISFNKVSVKLLINLYKILKQLEVKVPASIDKEKVEKINSEHDVVEKNILDLFSLINKTSEKNVFENDIEEKQQESREIEIVLKSFKKCPLCLQDIKHSH